MDSIVLRDRNGKEINYHGVDYLNVKTPDGETQGYAAYDPETLVPENLVSGVKVGDVEGALKVPQAVETTIDPDFSTGDMEIVPEDGQVFSKVGVLKPANLTPENIAEGVDIGGIIGILAASGGGAPIPCMFMASAASMYVKYAASSGLTVSVSVNIPADATVIGQYSAVSSGISKYSTSLSETAIVLVGNTCNSGYCSTTSSVSGTTRTLTLTDTISKAINSSYPVVYGVRLLSVIFTMPGIYKIGNSAGTMDIYTDETVTSLPTYGTIMVSVSGNIGTVDLSKSIITTIPSYFLYGTRAAKVIFPPCLTEIKSYALTTNKSGTVYDFSQAQSVPTLANSSAISCSGDSQILVPAALYDEWIAATNWSAKADYIVAV